MYQRKGVEPVGSDLPGIGMAVDTDTDIDTSIGGMIGWLAKLPLVL
jgi:hypothetical protein